MCEWISKCDKQHFYRRVRFFFTISIIYSRNSIFNESEITPAKEKQNTTTDIETKSIICTRIKKYYAPCHASKATRWQQRDGTHTNRKWIRICEKWKSALKTECRPRAQCEKFINASMIILLVVCFFCSFFCYYFNVRSIASIFFPIRHSYSNDFFFYSLVRQIGISARVRFVVVHVCLCKCYMFEIEINFLCDPIRGKCDINTKQLGAATKIKKQKQWEKREKNTTPDQNV